MSRGRWELVDGDVTIVEDLVLRPARPWTRTVHALLRHLRAQGLTSVPEPVGIKGDVEGLRFIPGDSGRDAWQHQRSLDGVRSAAALLREIHDATRGFAEEGRGQWAFPPEPGADVVCHGDPGPWNFVWDGDTAVALVDWDFARPGPGLDDVAYALEYFTPFRSDEIACDQIDGLHHEQPPDRAVRMAAFASAYGLESVQGMVDRVISRQLDDIGHVQDLAERGLEPQRTWVEHGYLDELQGRVRWSRDHRHLFGGG